MLTARYELALLYVLQANLSLFKLPSKQKVGPHAQLLPTASHSQHSTSHHATFFIFERLALPQGRAGTAWEPSEQEHFSFSSSSSSRSSKCRSLRQNRLAPLFSLYRSVHRYEESSEQCGEVLTVAVTGSQDDVRSGALE